jgi:hypothetical protein
MESPTITEPPPWPAPAVANAAETGPARAALAMPATSPIAGLSAEQWQVARLQAAQWHADRQVAEQQLAARYGHPWLAPHLASAPRGPSRRHRRRAALVAVLVLVALVAAGAVMVVLRSQPAAAAYSLDVAAIDVQDTTTLSYDLDMAMSDGSQVHSQVEMDLGRGLASVEMDDGYADWQLVMDLDDHVMYVQADAFTDMGLDVDGAEWVRYDLDRVVDMDDVTGLYGLGENPLDAAQLFDAAEQVDDLGFEDVDGVRVKHYEVTLDASDVLGTDLSEIDSSGLATHGFVNDGDADPEGKIVYDVYVNEWNEIAKLTFGMELLGEYVSVDMTVTSVDEVVEIDLPDPSDVADWDDVVEPLDL